MTPNFRSLDCTLIVRSSVRPFVRLFHRLFVRPSVETTLNEKQTPNEFHNPTQRPMTLKANGAEHGTGATAAWNGGHGRTWAGAEDTLTKVSGLGQRARWFMCPQGSIIAVGALR